MLIGQSEVFGNEWENSGFQSFLGGGNWIPNLEPEAMKTSIARALACCRGLRSLLLDTLRDGNPLRIPRLHNGQLEP
jgi:hypothetical protein